MGLAFAHPHPSLGLRAMIGLGIRPPVGFNRPDDVVKDEGLTSDEKRAMLSSWASDLSAVADRPGWRWLAGTPAPVPYGEVRDALAALDRQGWASFPSA